MLIKRLTGHNEFLITVDIEQLARNANVTPELMKLLLSSPREFSVTPNVFGCMYKINQLPIGCLAPRPPVHALTHQVMGPPRLDVSGEICQIKIQLMPESGVVHDSSHMLIPMLQHVMDNELAEFGDQTVDLRQCTVLVPRIVNVGNWADKPNYARSFEQPIPVTEDLAWEIHGWDFVYALPDSVTGDETDIGDPAIGKLELYLDHDDPNPAGTLASIIKLYFSSSSNLDDSLHTDIQSYHRELDVLLDRTQELLTQESPALSPQYIDGLMKAVRGYAMAEWVIAKVKHHGTVNINLD